MDKLSIEDVEKALVEAACNFRKREHTFLQKLLDTMRENERLRDWLRYISFFSNGVPTVINGEDVPEKWQAEINRALRYLGQSAEEALEGFNSPSGDSCKYTDVPNIVGIEIYDDEIRYGGKTIYRGKVQKDMVDSIVSDYEERQRTKTPDTKC